MIRENDKPWFTSELRKEIRKRDRFRKCALKSKKDSDVQKYKRQRNRVNDLKKLAKENFEKRLDNIILENTSNSKTYWKLMKMLIKSNKGHLAFHHYEILSKMNTYAILFSRKTRNVNFLINIST